MRNRENTEMSNERWEDVVHSYCQHKATEDCIICAICGQCREDLDSDDICMDCGGAEID